MKLLLENWRDYLNEERAQQLMEEQVKKIFVEQDYILTEELLQEIDWGKAKRLMSKGIVGLALIGALTGIARPVMANPTGGECASDECSVELAPETEEMKKELAELVAALIGDTKPTSQELKEIYLMAGWRIIVENETDPNSKWKLHPKWGSHLNYLK